MQNSQILIGRRAALAGAAALAATPALAQLPPGLTQGVVDAANKEGKGVWYTSIELSVAEAVAKSFMQIYPKITIQTERNGAERVLQRLTQEYASGIHTADVVESSDITIFELFKSKGWLARFLPEDVKKSWPAEERDADGHYATVRATLSTMGYNTDLVKPADAPKGFIDALRPEWKAKLVKASPNYSGVIAVSTYVLSHALGWGYFEKLAKQRVMQVQSATQPPKVISEGERPVAIDGGEYVFLNYQQRGNPIALIYPEEGSPLISGPAAAMQNAPHPNVARLFTTYLFSQVAQQMMVDKSNLRSFHPDIKEPAGRVKLSQLKLLRASAQQLTAGIEATKKKYTEIFRV
ncbi:MAG: extracellular solute-binding protein [Acetobacteraceae bacterium]